MQISDCLFSRGDAEGRRNARGARKGARVRRTLGIHILIAIGTPLTTRDSRLTIHDRLRIPFSSPCFVFLRMAEKSSTPWYASSLGRFRTVAIAEGVSFLILVGIAMPLKYMAGKPGFVDVFGWAHGLLFIGYMITGLQMKIEHNWPLGKTTLAVIAALIPFGPFILDRKILQKEQ